MTRLIALGFLAMTLGACGGRPDETAVGGPGPAPVKNLLLICIDTVRADTFFQLGELQPDRLQAWQKRALVYTQANASSPWTVPSVASAFTGLWTVQHGAGAVSGLQKAALANEPPRRMYPDVETIAQAATRAGFNTTVVSASQWTFEKSAGGVDINRGFENFHKFVPDTAAMGAVHWKPMVERWAGLSRQRATDSRNLDFMHLLEAHNWHFVPTGRIEKRFSRVTAEQWELYRSTAPPRACMEADSLYCQRYLVYAHAVGVMRNAVANMLDTLEQNGQLQDTVVVLFADHGEEFNDHGDDGRKLSYAGKEAPFIGHGISLYQELLHVPLVVWHPALDGAVIDTPVSLVDIAPSAARWLGLDFAPANLAGRLLPERAEDMDSGPRVLYASGIVDGENQRSARQGREKAIWYMATDRTDYYDLQADPGERQSQPITAGLLRFDGYFLDYRDMEPTQQSESATFTAEQLKHLQAIGYLQGLDAEEEGD